MNRILAASNNFKILQPSIAMVTILMICFLPNGDFSDKCFQDKAVNPRGLIYSILRKTALQIEPLVSNGTPTFQNSSSRNALNPAKITDNISSFIADNWTPPFHTERLS